jgi:altronate dehydratase small subunit
MEKAVILHSEDNVATVTSDIAKGSKIAISLRDNPPIEIEVKEFIPKGHKFALTRISQNEKVVKYGNVIGRATRVIKTGEMVHVHNVESLRGRGDLR